MVQRLLQVFETKMAPIVILVAFSQRKNGAAAFFNPFFSLSLSFFPSLDFIVPLSLSRRKIDDFRNSPAISVSPQVEITRLTLPPANYTTIRTCFWFFLLQLCLLFQDVAQTPCTFFFSTYLFPSVPPFILWCTHKTCSIVLVQ